MKGVWKEEQRQVWNIVSRVEDDQRKLIHGSSYDPVLERSSDTRSNFQFLRTEATTIPGTPGLRSRGKDAGLIIFGTFPSTRKMIDMITDM